VQEIGAREGRGTTRGARRRVWTAVCVSAWMAIGGEPLLHAQGSQEAEYRAKAVFLTKFPSFVEWPEEAIPAGKATFLICVYGDFLFGMTLMESARGETVHGKRMEVKWMHKEKELRACQILFVSRSETKRYKAVLEALQGTSVLTVGETPDFLAAGGAISFLVQQDSLQFEVNLEGASEAHLKLSSNMLALARRVVSKTTEVRK